MSKHFITIKKPIVDYDKLKHLLETNEEVKVLFVKKDGSLREMLCTRVMDYVKTKNEGNTGLTGGGEKYNPKNYGLIPVFDLEKKEWRSINSESIICELDQPKVEVVKGKEKGKKVKGLTKTKDIILDYDKLQQLLTENEEVKVTFVKKDGSLREMLCTRNFVYAEKKLGKTFQTTGEGKKYDAKEKGLITVMDLEKKEWRNITVAAIQLDDKYEPLVKVTKGKDKGKKVSILVKVA